MVTQHLFNLLLLSTIYLNVNGDLLDLQPAIDEKCLNLRHLFADASAQFTLCSVNNSRPITFCENCMNAFLALQKSYDNMSETDDNGTRCIDHFTNLDRLQIVKVIHLNGVNLWNEAKCSECYNFQHPLEPTESNATRLFLDYYKTLSNCIDSVKDDKLCDNCIDHYITLDTYYKQISNVNERISMCMDIVDMMNTTWTFWSERCCKWRRHDEYVFIASTLGVLLLTVCFYLLTLFIREKRAPTIIQQSRFAESFNNILN